MFWVGFYLPLELTVQMCVCPSHTVLIIIPFYAQLKGFVPYLSPLSVGILLRLALVMVL